jgi:hypothetical protein
MSNIIEIKEGDVVLARYIPSGVAWQEGLSFFSQNPDFVQVGTWVYDAEKKLNAHTHNEVERKVLWTQEVLFVRKGRIQANIFNSKEQKVTEMIVDEGDILILLQGGHGYEILQNGTQVLEVKNGPYIGADLDRRRF